MGQPRVTAVGTKISGKDNRVVNLRIMGIHGVGQFRPGLSSAEAATELATTWAEALAGTGLGVDLRVAYYADRLRIPVAQDTSDGLDWLTPTQYEALLAWADQLDARPADTAQAAWSIPARMIVDLIARRRTLNALLLRPFVATFLREVDSYLASPDAPVRQDIRDHVAAEIRAHRPNIVFAHSLGSVVAYETLWAHSDLSPDLLVTAGSPLALSGVVFDRLQPAPRDGVGVRPPNVGRWVNVADPGDLIAVPRPFTRRFTPDESHEDEHIHALAFHSATRYLAARPTVAALLSSGP